MSWLRVFVTWCIKVTVCTRTPVVVELCAPLQVLNRLDNNECCSSSIDIAALCHGVESTLRKVFPWIVEHSAKPSLTISDFAIRILVFVTITIGIKLWQERASLKQAVDIAPVHTALCQIVAPIVANRDILSDGNGVEVLSLQKHMVAVDADGVTFVVRSLASTHDTFVTSIGVGHGEF